MTWANPYIPAAFLVAGITATFKVQYQALLYFLVVVYAVNTLEEFTLVSLLYVVMLLFSQFYRANISAK